MSGVDLHVVRRPGDPDRPPLVFVHDIAHAAWCFEEHWLDAAADAGWPSLALTLRAHSGSQGTRAKATTGGYVDDVCQTLRTLPEPAIMVGHGYGAVVSRLAAIRHPTRGIVMVAPYAARGNLGLGLRHLRQRPIASVRAALGGPLPLRPDLFFHNLDLATAAGYVDRMDREPPIVQWELLRPRRPVGADVPVAIIASRDDALVPTELIPRADPFAPIDWLDGIGHDMMLDGGWEAALARVLAAATELTDASKAML